MVGYEPDSAGWRLVRRQALYTDLDSLVRALTGGIALPKEKFEDQLRRNYVLQRRNIRSLM